MFDQKFGEPWGDPPQLEYLPRGATPVGKECMHCGKPIQAGDQGVQLYAVEQVGAGGRTLAPLHRECIDPWLKPEREA